MPADPTDRVEWLFDRLSDLEPPERERILDEECGDDPTLRAEVEKLLDHDSSASESTSFLITPISAPPDARTLEPGHVVAGRYTLRRVLGEGGMGTVWLAEQDQPRRDVALKLIRRGLATREIIRRFEFEVTVLGRLKHPGIAQIYEAGMHDTGGGARPFFAMEYVKGAGLHEIIRKYDLDVKQRLELFTHIGDAVHHAHQRGVIHRDLKPSNILVELLSDKLDADAVGMPKILDFGVARVTDVDRQLTIATEVGRLIGTLAYMSPEQVEGDSRKVDTRSDVYALGVILYQMLTDQLPYVLSDKTIAQAVRIITEQDPAPLSRHIPGVHGDLTTIVRTALAKDVEQRYQSAHALIEDIRHYLNDEPIRARPATVMYQLRTFARRHKGMVAAAVGFVILLVASTIITSVLLVRAVTAEARAQQRFDDTRNLANAFLFDVHDQIAKLPGSTRAREFIVSTGLDYLDRLAADAGDDPTLQLDIARGYMKVGDVQAGLLGPSLGDSEGARESYEKAYDILARLDTRTNGRDRRVRQVYGDVCRRQGDILYKTADFDSSLTWYQRAIETHQRLLDADGSDADVRYSLAADYSALTLLQQYRGEHDEALASVGEAMRIGRSLIEPEGNMLPNHRLATSLFSRRGNVYRSLGMRSEARADLEEAMRIAEELVANDPNNMSNLRTLHVSQVMVGDLAWGDDDLDDALSYFEAALVIRRNMVERDPENGQARVDLATGLERVADVLMDLDRLDEAVPLHEEALDLRRAMAADDPANLQALRELSVGCEKMGNSFLGRDEFDEAARYYLESREIRRRLSEANPASAQAQRDESVSIFKLGAVEHARGIHAASPLSIERKRAALTLAIERYNEARDRVMGHLESGLAGPADAHIPDFLKEQIELCEAAIDALPANED